MSSTHLELQISICVTAKLTLPGRKKKVRLVQILYEKQQQTKYLHVQKGHCLQFEKQNPHMLCQNQFYIYPHLYKIESLPKKPALTKKYC